MDVTPVTHSGALYKGSPDAGNMELVHFSFCLQGIIGFTLSPLVERSERNSGPKIRFKSRL